MKITRLAILITLTFSVLKSQATEFNASLLDSGNLSNVDLTAFSREGYVAPGNYILDIWLNDQPVPDRSQRGRPPDPECVLGWPGAVQTHPAGNGDTQLGAAVTALQIKISLSQSRTNGENR